MARRWTSILDSLRGDVDLHRHRNEISGRAVITSNQRRRLRSVASDGDTDEIAAADERVRRVELDPTRPGQVDLRPCMRRAAANEAAGGADELLIVEVPRHEARR